MPNQFAVESLYHHWTQCADLWDICTANIDMPTGLAPDFADFLAIALTFQMFRRLTIAYGLLYVVVEGYKELKLKDDDIDFLLSKNDYVVSLRRLRNSIFHYQSHPIPKKFMEFIDIPDSEMWIGKLRKSFKIYFINKFPHILELEAEIKKP